MMQAEIQINTAPFERTLAEFLSHSKRAKSVVIRQQAKLFVRDVILVTPPNKNFQQNRAGGEETIDNDVAKSVQASRASDAPPAAQVHAAARALGRAGRVPRKIDSQPGRDVAGLKRELKRKVGILASGWNAAAEMLGSAVPAFVRRHGTSRGSVSVRPGRDSFSIRMVNAVPFVGDVKGMLRRVQTAYDNRARQMRKQLDDFAVKQAAKKAGLKIK